MDQLKTISTFDVKGPIRKEDHLRVINAHNSLGQPRCGEDGRCSFRRVPQEEAAGDI